MSDKMRIFAALKQQKAQLYMEDKKQEMYAAIDTDCKRRKAVGGRQASPEAQKLIIDCLFEGKGYAASVPDLIAAGFTRNNKCRISKRQFEYVREKYFHKASLFLEMDADIVRFAKEHQAEVIALLREFKDNYVEQTSQQESEEHTQEES